jgi:uncharacterized RDD family membrane protein YckC
MPQPRNRAQCNVVAQLVWSWWSEDRQLNQNDNPYGLPPVPPQYGNSYGSPYGPPPGPPPNLFGNPNAKANPYPQNPYAPPSIGAQGPAWAQSFGQVQQPLASPGARLGAHLLDGLLYFGAVMVGLPAAAFDETLSGMLALLGMLGLAIYQWYLVSTTGQSLGKKWVGIRIVKLDGSPVDFSSGVLLRSWAFYGLVFVGGLFVIGSVLPLVDALMIFGDERRCLRDHLAGTKVIVA